MENAVEDRPHIGAVGAKRLEGKVAIITGSALGIGRATAERFAREGATVVVVDLNETAVKETAEALASEYGVETLGAAANVTDKNAVVAAVKATIEKFGKVDVLVNNAGITKDGLMLRMPEADWDLVMSINLKGAFLCTQAVLRSMMKARSGRIINVASVVGMEGNAGQANYAASKGGVIAFTKSCAKEFASRNILVNAIAPGFIHTRLTDAIPEGPKKKLYERITLSRIGEPSEIANAIFFLASDDSTYMTGQVLVVDGGREL
ncbi:MAG: 3-oxoacyl-[acyl-carrier-protein] reductase [Elusimicrobia bacterium]|nr:MAG: 3-oxoacyl-[acyl-carrier-protein] reductase [Elusimicrobiota bacterium]